jgi:hypothetical protein
VNDSEDFANFVMDKLNEAGISPDVLISLPDKAGAFVWVDIEGQQLWRITVEPAEFA